MTLAINIGRQQLAVSLNRKCGRPKKTLFERFQNFASYLIRAAKDKRLSGNPASRVLRRVFENKRIKKALGFNLTALILLFAISIGLIVKNAKGRIWRLRETRSCIEDICSIWRRREINSGKNLDGEII